MHGCCRVRRTMNSLQNTSRLRFGLFELDLSTAELLKNGRRVRLQDQPARLLILLASRPGELVTRTEIQTTLWEEGRFVEFDHAVNTAIKKVREALDDDSENPKIIETLPRKGYRFIAAIEILEKPADIPATPNPELPTPAQDVKEVPEPEFSVEVLERAPSGSIPLPPESLPRRRRNWLIAVLLIALTLSIGAAVMNSRTPPVPNKEMHLEVVTPPTADPTSVAISPDGLKIVFVAISEGR